MPQRRKILGLSLLREAPVPVLWPQMELFLQGCGWPPTEKSYLTSPGGQSPPLR